MAGAGDVGLRLYSRPAGAAATASSTVGCRNVKPSALAARRARHPRRRRAGRRSHPVRGRASSPRSARARHTAGSSPARARSPRSLAVARVGPVRFTGPSTSRIDHVPDARAPRRRARSTATPACRARSGPRHAEPRQQQERLEHAARMHDRRGAREHDTGLRAGGRARRTPTRRTGRRGTTRRAARIR